MNKEYYEPVVGALFTVLRDSNRDGLKVGDTVEVVEVTGGNLFATLRNLTTDRETPYEWLLHTDYFEPVPPFQIIGRNIDASLGIDSMKFGTPLGGTKHDDGKPRMDLLSPQALVEIANVLSVGAKKYDDHNWRKGFDWSRLYGAALRHLLAHMDGEDHDPETGLSHLAHAGCCIMFLIEHESKGLGNDDRYKKEV